MDKGFGKGYNKANKTKHMPHPEIIAIACIRKHDQAIGRKNELLFRIKENIKFFTGRTIGHTVIMGRNNWDSIPAQYRPLKERLNIVLSRRIDTKFPEGVFKATTLEAAIGLATVKKHGNIFIIGGGQVYQEALRKKLVDLVVLTVVNDPEGEDNSVADTFFAPNHEWKNDFEPAEEKGVFKRVRDHTGKFFERIPVLVYRRKE